MRTTCHSVQSFIIILCMNIWLTLDFLGLSPASFASVSASGIFCEISRYRYFCFLQCCAIDITCHSKALWAWTMFMPVLCYSRQFLWQMLFVFTGPELGQGDWCRPPWWSSQVSGGGDIWHSTGWGRKVVCAFDWVWGELDMLFTAWQGSDAACSLS